MPAGGSYIASATRSPFNVRPAAWVDRTRGVGCVNTRPFAFGDKLTEDYCPTRQPKLVVTRCASCATAFDEASRQPSRLPMHYSVIPVGDKLALARFLSGVDQNGRRVPPSARAILFLLIDCEASRHWCSERIARACGVTSRTVTRAFAYWRARGVISVHRRQRQTAQKAVNVDAALHCAKQGVELVKAICAVARVRARSLVRTFISGNDHLLKKEAPWKEPGPATTALKRLLKRQAGRSSP